MRRAATIVVVAVAWVCTFPATAVCEVRQRHEVAEKYKWNLQHIYESDQAWQQAKDHLAEQLNKILGYKGRLNSSADVLLECLELDSSISKQLSRLDSYAQMKSDEDTRVAKYLAMKQQVQQLATEYRAKSSFIQPEIAAMGRQTIERFLQQQPRLQVYRMPLFDILRRKAHTLTETEERLLAQAALLASGPYSIYGVFSNAEFPYPRIALSDGTQAYLNKAGYAQYRAVANRTDREAVFTAFFGALNQFKETFGAQLGANVQKDVFFAKARRYGSSLERALDADNIPVQVYHALIENVTANLETFWRYLELKRRMLAVEHLKYSDVYAPVVKGVQLRYSYEQAKELVLESLKPLGPEYCQVVRRAFEERWIDVYPTVGKRSGAYSNGSAYDVHPYILLNFNGLYEDVSTLAHELGHALHSYYSNKTQPYATADYSTFVAEVASTFNEALLNRRMLETIEDEDVRLALLMNYLETIRQTVFRQTQFAEFELRIHEMAERGEPLTGEVLSKVYGQILRKYYGHAEGICQIDDLYSIEWVYVPHFYYNFYVYQYATSFTASTALSEQVLGGGKDTVKRYIDFLSAGGSDYPIALLKKAGVDMTSSEPFEQMTAAMRRAMDQIERILQNKDKRGS